MPNYTVSGRVTCNGSGLAGVSMTGIIGTPVTTSTGFYTGQVAQGGTVTPVLTGYVFSPTSNTYPTQLSSEGPQNYTASALSSYLIAGKVLSASGAGIANVTMQGFPQTTVTDSSGNYGCTVLSGWSGTVTPSAGGYTFSPSDRVYTNVTSDKPNQNYTGTAAVTTYIISGTVSRGGVGLSGVRLLGLPDSTVTASDGTYSDTVPAGWSGTVTPSKSGYTFSAVSTAYSNVEADHASQNYAATVVVIPAPPPPIIPVIHSSSSSMPDGKRRI